MSAIALATRGVSRSFGSLAVARDITLDLPVGARYALIGPNGAGKTTLINLVTGMLKPDAGQILLGDEDITALEPQARVKRGLARTFQINTLFAGLNPLEAVTLVVSERDGLSRNFWRPLAANGAAQNTSLPSITPKISTIRKMMSAMKNSTLAMVRAPLATPVKPKKPATTETRKKMMAHLIMAVSW